MDEVHRHVSFDRVAGRRKAVISEVTFYNWRKNYAGLMPTEMRRLRQLEDENGKPKKLVADLSHDRAMLQDVLTEFTSRELDL